MQHKYDLTITKCESLIFQIFEGGSAYLSLVDYFKSLSARIDKLTSIYTKQDFIRFYKRKLNYFQLSRLKLVKNQNISKSVILKNYDFKESELEQLSDMPDNNEIINLLKHKNDDHYYSKIFKAFSLDNYEFTPEKNDNVFFSFLLLMLADYDILYIDEILDYHYKKAKEKNNFIRRLSIHLMDSSEQITDKNITKVILGWIEYQNKQPKQNNTNNTKTIKELALTAFYNNEIITKEKNGSALYNNYCKIKTIGDRLAVPTSKTTYKNKIILFEKVISNLENNAKNNAIEELNKFKTKYSSEFEK